MEEMAVIEQTKCNASVVVRDAYKRYAAGVNVILNGLNLTVKEGAVYGLLGPSGCGKTTLLKCVVGRIALDSGSIKISVKKRSDIGFMPQEISLYTELTVFENFLFFGYLLGMTKEEIAARTNQLISFLEIPSKDRFVRNMSTGQQRRLSIAVTFLHDPKIIILDEPTVGIDPILCHQIWQKLLDLAQQGKSIIVTTHYIQEAQQAHTIGLMRDGKLLAEENPLILLNRYQCDDLENVFLKLIYDEQRTQNGGSVSSAKELANCRNFVNKNVRVRYEGDDRRYSRKIIFALTYKNLQLMKRGYTTLLFSLALPLIQCYLFNVAVGSKPQDLSLAVINDEIPLRNCHAGSFNGCFFDNDVNVPSSCLFLKYLKKERYKIVAYFNETDALKDLRRSEIRAVLHFPKDYTKRVAEKLSGGLFRKYNESIYDGYVDVWLDNSDRLIEDFIRYDILRSFVFFVRNATMRCGKNPDIAAIPLVFETPIRGKTEASFDSYTSCAFLISGSFFFAAFSTSLFFITEKVGGQMDRIFVSGVTMFETIVALTILQFTMSAIQSIFTMLITFIRFDNPLEGNVMTFVSLLWLTNFSGVFFGIVQTIISTNVTAAAYSGVGAGFILGVTSGMFGPREAQHEILQYISAVLPITWSVDAARKISNRGSAITHPDVLRGFYATIAWNALFFFVIWYYTKFRNNRSTNA